MAEQAGAAPAAADPAAGDGDGRGLGTELGRGSVLPSALGWRALLWLLLAYSLAWELGYRGSSEYWFLPAGLRVAALLRLPARQWPWLFAVELITLVLHGVVLNDGYRTLTGAILGMVAPFVCAAAALAWWRPRASPLREAVPLTLARLLFACSVAALLTAFCLALMLWVEQRAVWPQLPASLLRYWIGDVIGILIVTPLLVQIGFPDPVWRRWAVWRSCLQLALPVSGLLWMAHRWSPDALPYLAVLALFPPVWLAMRAGWRGAALAVSLTSILLYFAPTLFSAAIPPSVLQMMLAVVGSIALLLGAWVTAEDSVRRRLEGSVTRLAELNDALRQSTQAARALAVRLVDAQEAERARLRQELSRLIGPALNEMSSQLTLLARDLQQPESLRTVDTLRGRLHDLRKVFEHSFEFLQPGELGQRSLCDLLRNSALAEALEAAAVAFQLDWQLDTEGWSEEQRLPLLRLLQQLMLTAVHAGAAEALQVKVTGSAATSVQLSAQLTYRTPLPLEQLREAAAAVALVDRLRAVGADYRWQQRDPRRLSLDAQLPIGSSDQLPESLPPLRS